MPRLPSAGPTAIRAVLFDLDETLVDRSATWRVFARHVLAERLHPFDLDATLATIAAADLGGYRPKVELFATLAHALPWTTPTSDEAIEALWRRTFHACAIARAGAGETIAALRERGIRLAIVTNGRDEMQRAKIATLGLTDAVDAIVTSGAIGTKKPDPRIFKAALDAIGGRAAHAIYVGDHPMLDIAGPMALGLRAAWLRLGRPWTTDVPPPTWAIDALPELISIVDRQ